MDKHSEDLKLETFPAPEMTSILSEKLSNGLRVSGLDAPAAYAAAMASLTYDNHQHNPNPTDRIINIRTLHSHRGKAACLSTHFTELSTFTVSNIDHLQSTDSESQ